MLVRIARFEGVEPRVIDTQLERFREMLAVARSGQVPEGIPADAFQVLVNDVTRVIEVADRANDVIVDLTFAHNAEAMERVHQALDQLSPPENGGKRTSVETYEVLLDEQMTDPLNAPRRE
jgi:hypothetical protein